MDEGMDDLALLLMVERMFGGPVAGARALGVHYGTWWRWKKGERKITPRTRRQLETLLKSK